MEKVKKAFMSAIKNPIIWISAVYLLFPADFIPDTYPVVGTLDDLIATILIAFVVALLGKED